MQEHQAKGGKETYCCVILGTGIKESILAGLLSSAEMKVLQIDTSGVYGSSSRTLRYEEYLEEMKSKLPLHTQFRNLLGEEGKELYIDLTPKIFLADEGLIRVIAENNLAYCMEFNIIAEQYLVQEKKEILIPNTKTSALKSGLCGPLQLIKLHKFMSVIKSYYNAPEEEKQRMSSQWKSVEAMYEAYGISVSVQKLLGHGVALYTSEEYLKDPPKEFIHRLTTYFRSVARVNGASASKGNSPFLYPKYGISEISQGFARLSAVKGGTTRMCTEILRLTKEQEGYAMTIKTEEEETEVFTRCIVANSEYYSCIPNSFRKEVHTLRGVYILKGPSTIQTKQALVTTEDPQRYLFLLVVGEEEGVCPEGFFIGYVTGEYNKDTVPVSSVLEYTPDAQTELARQTRPATERVEAWGYHILQSFFWVDLSVEGTPGVDPFIVPLAPMDNTVDFRTVHREVQEVSKEVHLRLSGIKSAGSSQ
ncbi:Rab GDP dissociation inhibitor [Nematocida sp. AWRm77]|nr:Rab GDP dissociation inhibitor [Nematocida sp. AWRm77]